MKIPETGSLWLDQSSLASANRYILVTGLADEEHVRAVTWYDELNGHATLRRTTLAIQGFQPKANGVWARTGKRPARREPKYGRPKLED